LTGCTFALRRGDALAARDTPIGQSWQSGRLLHAAAL
jgi:hypothetical protein